jgi:cation transport ATPase
VKAEKTEDKLPVKAVKVEKTEDELAEEEWEKAAKESEQAAVSEKKRKEAEKKHAEKEETKETTGEADADVDADAHEELHPHRRKIHKLFFFISVVAMIAALSMATGQIVGLVFKKLGPVQWVLRGYVVALCFLVLFTELEMTKLARENIILHNWICRGLLYSFIGVLGLEENDTAVYKDDPPLGSSSAKFFMNAVSWIIIGKSIMSKIPPS